LYFHVACYLLLLLQYTIQILHMVASSISVVFAVCSLYVPCIALWMYTVYTIKEIKEITSKKKLQQWPCLIFHNYVSFYNIR
jgi:hypothetical protein